MQSEHLSRYRKQARRLKGLANGTRLAEGDCHATERAGRLEIGQSAVSRHLALLRAQGISPEHREGAHVNYMLNIPCAPPLVRCTSEACNQHRASDPSCGGVPGIRKEGDR